jgi:hypothetical protein
MTTRLARALLVAALALAVARAGAQEANSEGALEVGLWKRLDPHDMLYFPASITRAGEVDHAEALLGASYDRIFPRGFSARVGYRYLWELSPPTNVQPYREHRVIAELFVRPWPGGRFELLDRTRLELRWVDGIPSWRLRNRLRAGRTIGIRRDKSLLPYGSLEASYDSRFRTINRLRLSVGIAVKLTSRVLLDTYVAEQHDTRGNGAPLQSLGMTLNLTL